MATVKDAFASVASFTITLASLASSTTGGGRQSTIVDNTTNLYTSAQIELAIKVGTSPTANSLIYVYLIRDNNDVTPLRDDGAGASDATITIINAPLLGTILCNASTTGATYRGIFDTKPLGSLGPKWGIAIVNATGVNLDSTEANHIKSYIGITQTVA